MNSATKRQLLSVLLFSLLLFVGVVGFASFSAHAAYLLCAAKVETASGIFSMEFRSNNFDPTDIGSTGRAEKQAMGIRLAANYAEGQKVYEFFDSETGVELFEEGSWAYETINTRPLFEKRFDSTPARRALIGCTLQARMSEIPAIREDARRD